ncbi:hypothetical protein [Qipengyuania gaetbuli]|uniref:hypothetical protein n=1 Tax=Qipengyuania gaetbuli TaxID=266952 RepID=UPI001CD63F43|nr:hypothetical protein [Qipengyuania gaetbuli]MCA0909616.1 hypothetical protein [Qipengyuania gaetbuli]
MKRLTIIALGALTLAACQDQADEAGATGDAQRAEGEVLGGTIDDSMLPLDTVTSQAPPLRQAPSEGSSGDTEDASEEDGDEAEADAAPEEGTQAEPAEEAEPEA